MRKVLDAVVMPTEFVRARIAEDERNAVQYHSHDCFMYHQHGFMMSGAYGTGDGRMHRFVECGCRHPARIIADNRAKRYLLAEHADARWERAGEEGCYECDGLCRLVLIAAAGYVDHEDYDDAWRSTV